MVLKHGKLVVKCIIEWVLILKYLFYSWKIGIMSLDFVFLKAFSD